ncbi:MAG: hypothetical protein CL991_04155 [Euryarchaeota archaeon]|nr:hypothetical protein [Euryarchaeota archaeon]MEC7279441.1 4a-hydroxytetrahydrobiopterin dehydratase [Candidatus Thermoplasmatota archaeon]MEC8079547.1 4a-hydroxytetrahydrobiopterin dehydratase [Candidatus Thermoplasmatota archaeon]MEC8266857.1 4a-hydroxytetrahydrobiopterin dehydratase [Candidatus Thermoplasmatota archaeon]MEC8780608.1 4a-hydroxytetrahydrobiopterin dehydratase [Candidatus Thermoplasmatota archaeon]
MMPVSGWDEVDGGLERSWSFDDMAEAARCAQRIAVLCDEHDHHADVTFGWGHLKVRTTTHDAGHTVTGKDRALAEAVDALMAEASTSFRKHVFVCLHERPEGAQRPSCGRRGSTELMMALKRSAKAMGLGDVRVQKSGCLDRCEEGPSAVVYPEATWWTLPDDVEAAAALAEHLR